MIQEPNMGERGKGKGGMKKERTDGRERHGRLFKEERQMKAGGKEGMNGKIGK